jgi:lysophospholipase L1-like esterase
MLSTKKILTLVILVLPASASARDVHANDAQMRWVGSWAASQQLVEPNNALNPEDLRDATLRQIVHLSIGGNEIRVRLSNRFGSTPLTVTAIHIARAVSPDSSKIVLSSDKALTFSGSPDIIIPPHADYLSDPVSFPVDALSDVAVTMHLDESPAEQTGHPGSRATSYVGKGNLVSAPELQDAKGQDPKTESAKTQGFKTIDHWYFIAGLDVSTSPEPSAMLALGDSMPEASAIVVLGDSITDGHGATTNGNDRWTDVLARRLSAQPGTGNLAVLNQGIGGNHLLTDGLGPNALSRIDHDVIAQPGVRYLIVFEGINDIGMLARSNNPTQKDHDSLFHRMTAAYEQISVRAHTSGIKVIGATLTPFVGSDYYHPGPANEADRQAVNDWIRNPAHFDAVIDFDKIVRDPQHPDRLLPAFDCGDHLHPSPAGYAAMAQGVPLTLFTSTNSQANAGLTGRIVSHTKAGL